jgi:uncharacterized protein (TIGR00369 family)
MTTATTTTTHDASHRTTDESHEVPETPAWRYWKHLRRVPGSAAVLSRVVSLAVPYAASIAPEIVAVEPGYARLQMRDRRRVRNHLGTIHAMALGNLAETTGNAAVVAALPPGAKFVVTDFAIAFVKKARGTITSECRVTLPPLDARDTEIALEVTMTNASGDVVARARSLCRVRKG